MLIPKQNNSDLESITALVTICSLLQEFWRKPRKPSHKETLEIRIAWGQTFGDAFDMPELSLLGDVGGTLSTDLVLLVFRHGLGSEIPKPLVLPSSLISDHGPHIWLNIASRLAYSYSDTFEPVPYKEGKTFAMGSLLEITFHQTYVSSGFFHCRLLI